MAGLSDLFGKHGAVEQLFLWNVVGEVVTALMGPAIATLTQDIDRAHPVQVLDPGTLADLWARGIITYGNGETDAAKSGYGAGNWEHLAKLHTVRVSPADLATGVLRSYTDHGYAAEQARLQGWDEHMFTLAVNLAGDAIGPQQAVEALRRGIIGRDGRGPGATSYEQAIAESRLHDKWGPVLADLGKQLLSPPDAASAVVRNFLGDDEGSRIAALSGVDAATFRMLVHLSGDAPGPQQLAEALRRGLIDRGGTGAGSTSFTQGIAEGRLADKWAPVIEGLSKLWPTPVDALDASVKGVFDAETGKRMYEHLGGDPAFYDWLLYSIGEGPTPLEAAVLAARGIIPWKGTGPKSVSYEQAVKESHYRDKWTEPYKRLAEHIPPPGTVVTLLSHRQLKRDQAHQLLLENDMAPDLAAAYIGEAEYEAVSDYRGLTESAVISLYVGRIIGRDKATVILEGLHVDPAAARYLLDYADMRYEIDAINKSVERIATLYTGRKIGVATARDALSKLGIPVIAIDDILTQWDIQAAADVKTLTEAQIADAFYYGVYGHDEAGAQAAAMRDLEAIGYTPYDAWLVLSVRVKGALPDRPNRDVAPPPGAVIPGTT